jgi:hypothetical protein
MSRQNPKIQSRKTGRPKRRLRFTGANAANVDSPDRVRTFPEWCQLNSISHDTGRRILASGKGPKVLQLSSNRIGIRDSDNKAWQDTLVRDGNDPGSRGCSG